MTMASTPNETATLRVERLFTQAPGRVWRALTQPELLARWWVAGDIAATVGHRFTLDMGRWGPVACQVIEVEPERRLAFTFGAWTLTFTLLAEGHGTRLILEQSGIDLNTPQGRFAFENMERGWREEVLPRLSALLDADGAS